MRSIRRFLRRLGSLEAGVRGVAVEALVVVILVIFGFAISLVVAAVAGACC